MRKQVEYYNGKEINRKVIKRTNLIDLKRIKEGITQFSMERIKSLKTLCKEHETNPEDEHVILGEDWYIVYTNISDMEIEIKDWIAINSVENKLNQTMEMFNALKKILLEYENCNIYAMLRHSTSYQFYKKFLDEGYIEEFVDVIDFDDYLPKITEIKQKILDEYDSIEAYLADPNRDRYEGSAMEDYIYHEVSFQITESFKKRYKKSGR